MSDLMSPSAVRHVFLTGQPGVGKTTLVLKAIDALKTSPRTIGGFITTERRDGRGERCGFDVVTVGIDPPSSGTLATKAAAGSRPGKGVPAVGNYVVDVADFERVALDVLGRDADGPGRQRPDVTVVDEVGKMELHCVDFLPAVRRAMEDESTTVFGTIPMPRYGRTVPAVEAVRHDPRVAVVHVRRENRDAAAVAVAKALAKEHLDIDALVPFLQEGQAAKLGLAMDGGDGDGVRSGPFCALMGFYCPFVGPYCLCHVPDSPGPTWPRVPHGPGSHMAQGPTWPWVPHGPGSHMAPGPTWPQLQK